VHPQNLYGRFTATTTTTQEPDTEKAHPSHAGIHRDASLLQHYPPHHISAVDDLKTSEQASIDRQREEQAKENLAASLRRSHRRANLTEYHP
jgi:hypothetical protein